MNPRNIVQEAMAIGGRDRLAGKRPANLTISTKLLEVVREAEAREWVTANRKAIDAYNARIGREGVWSDKLWSF